MKYIFYILIFVVLTSCTSKNEPDHTNVIEIGIDANDFNSSGNLSDIISNIKIVPLESNDSSLIMKIEKVICYNDFIFIFDRNAQRLLKFDFSGEFVQQIGKRGQGPGEYLEIIDFTIDKNNGNILIPDIYKLHVYSQNGLHLKTFRLDFLAVHMGVSNNEEFVFFRKEAEDALIICDSEGHIKNSFFPYYSKLKTGVTNYFTNDGEDLICHLPTCDTIFKIVDSKALPKYFLNFGNKAFTINDYLELPENDKQNLQEYLNDKCQCIYCFTFMPTKDFVFMHLRYLNNVYTGFYNKTNKTNKFIQHNKIENDFFNASFWFWPVGTFNNDFIMLLDSYKLIENADCKFLSTEENKKIISTLNQYSNPVLLIAKPK